MQTAPKLLYVAKRLKYGWYHYDDVIRFSTQWFCQSLAGVKEFQICKFGSQRSLCRGQLEKQGTGNGTGMGSGNGNLRKKRTEMRRLVVEILFINIPRDKSALTAILFMN